MLVTGGGRHNPVMMEMLRVALDCPVEPVEAVGLDGDMLEAQAFAHLAVRVARGLPTSCAGNDGRARGCVRRHTQPAGSAGSGRWTMCWNDKSGGRLGMIVLSTDETLEYEARLVL